MVVAHHASARLQKEREAHPVPSLTSTQLLCLCTKSLAVTLVPMVTLSIVYVVYVPDLPDRIATSFEESTGTGFVNSGPQLGLLVARLWRGTMLFVFRSHSVCLLSLREPPHNGT